MSRIAGYFQEANERDVGRLEPIVERVPLPQNVPGVIRRALSFVQMLPEAIVIIETCYGRLHVFESVTYKDAIRVWRELQDDHYAEWGQER